MNKTLGIIAAANWVCVAIPGNVLAPINALIGMLATIALAID